MPQGLQIWDAAGVLVFDTTSIVGILLGSVQVAENQMSGTISDSRLSNGKPFVVPFLTFSEVVLGVGNGTGTIITASQPVFSFGASSISWTRPAHTGQEQRSPGGIIHYGVYSGA